MHPQAEIAALSNVDLIDPLKRQLEIITEAMRAMCDALANTVER